MTFMGAKLHYIECLALEKLALTITFTIQLLRSAYTSSLILGGIFICCIRCCNRKFYQNFMRGSFLPGYPSFVSS